MAHDNSLVPVDSRKFLVERVVASRYITRSARLRDLLVYLSDRVLDDHVTEIHEQEVGHRVFGRTSDYDTASDNIVRVHASTLRKRLEQYFLSEGLNERVVIELPKGNYAPIFRDRPVPDLLPKALHPEMLRPEPDASESTVQHPRDWRLWSLAALALLFACATVYLLLKPTPGPLYSPLTQNPAVRQFWSQVFRPGLRTDIVLDDASIGLYQELTGRAIGLSNYFDRDYLRGLGDQSGTAKLDRETAKTMVLKRQTSYAGATLLWRLSEMSAHLGSKGTVQFARDYSFHDAKTNNAILLGNSRSNPWIEPFENRLGLRWKYESDTGTYFPVDTWSSSGGPVDNDRYRGTAKGRESPEGYAMIALLGNLGGTGTVLIISGTGGSAVNATGDFLSDQKSLAHLRSLLAVRQGRRVPAFRSIC